MGSKCLDLKGHFSLDVKLGVHLIRVKPGHKTRVVHRDSPWTGTVKGSMDRVHRGGPCFV